MLNATYAGDSLLAPEILAHLAPIMKPRRLSAGQRLFFKGDAGDCLYIVRSGEVKVVLPAADGQESILDVLREGDHFGEMALLDEQPRSADAVATQPSVVLALHREDFRAFLERHPAIAFPIFQALTHRLRRTTERLEEYLFLDLPGRLARTLLRLAGEYGEETPTGIRIDRPVTQQELADMVGATRPRVSDQLQRLRRQGIIGPEPRWIEILRLDALEQMAAC